MARVAETGVEAAGVPTIMEYTCFAPLHYSTVYLLIPTCAPRGTQDGWWYIVAYYIYYTVHCKAHEARKRLVYEG